MEEHQNQQDPESDQENLTPSGITRWLVILCVVLFGAAVFAIGYAMEQGSAVTDLKQQNQDMNSAVAQLRSQIDALSTKIAQMTPPPAPPAEATTAGEVAVGKSETRPAASTRPSRQDRRIGKMQAQLAEQQKELKQTQDNLASARSDLEGQLGSTRDELNGSIAKTHDELVALEKRGERLFFEFDLSKSKSFEREGPIEISLRKADTKHQNYDIMMLVNDHELSKKKVDLYEPIWLHEGDMPQPVQVVVNKIDKNHVHGYVSAPRYKESELASNTAAQPPVADSTTKLSSSPTSSTPANNSSTSSPSSSSTTDTRGQQEPVD